MNKFFIIASALILAGCGVNPASGVKAAESIGLTNVEVGSYTFFGCSEQDAFRSTFTATGTNGQKISGVMCSGWFKGITIRFD